MAESHLGIGNDSTTPFSRASERAGGMLRRADRSGSPIVVHGYATCWQVDVLLQSLDRIDADVVRGGLNVMEGAEVMFALELSFQVCIFSSSGMRLSHRCRLNE